MTQSGPDEAREKSEARPGVADCEGMHSGNYVRKRKIGQKNWYEKRTWDLPKIRILFDFVKADFGNEFYVNSFVYLLNI